MTIFKKFQMGRYGKTTDVSGRDMPHLDDVDDALFSDLVGEGNVTTRTNYHLKRLLETR
jgi:hypothetical protein